MSYLLSRLLPPLDDVPPPELEADLLGGAEDDLEEEEVGGVAVDDGRIECHQI